MLLSRNSFFLLLLCVFVLPQTGYKLYWLARSQRTIGVFCFTGHTLTSLGTSSHPVILFTIGKDSIFFNGNSNVAVTPGSPVPVRYRKDNPTEARLDNTLSIWGDTLAWSLYPFLVLLVLYLTPARLDPLIPHGAGIRLDGRKPFIHIITQQTRANEYSLP
ncbi:MAG TPA: hypothetical protein VHD83_05565 [Puia sp.]|nr:hypothetical protein [Puia sp.]